MSEILDHFDSRYIPRPQQVQALQAVERQWATHDVLVLTMPVGAGKSLVADCIAKWAHETQGYTATVATPTNNLLGQYRRELAGYELPPIRGRYGKDTQGWWRAKDTYHQSPFKACNYYHLLSHKCYGEVQVLDEAHSLISMLQDMRSVKLWKHLDPWPDYVRTSQDLLLWTAEYPDDPKLSKLTALLSEDPEHFTITHGTDLYRKKERQYIKVHPLSPRNNAPVLWPPRRVKKLVLMSATFNAEDVWDLGLDLRRVCYIDTESAIPASRRPVVYEPVANMGYKHQERELPALITFINKCLTRYPHRGIVHTTYTLARKLRQHLTDERLVWHGPENAISTYNSWRAEGPDSNSVLVACGMEQGIDLAHDLARWQLITKIQYPSLADPAVAAKAQSRPQWYQWAAARHLLQATGRVSRGPDDFGLTIITDKQFERLYRNKALWPGWFLEALE